MVVKHELLLEGVTVVGTLVPPVPMPSLSLTYKAKVSFRKTDMITSGRTMMTKFEELG